MFDRRVRIFLSILLVITTILVLRAVQLQVLQQGEWVEKAVQALSTVDLIPTTRGRLLDRNGKILADESACVDVCVDYRVIPREPNEAWVSALAKRRLLAHLGTDYTQADKSQRLALLTQEIAGVKAEIDAMWQMLADRGKMTIDQIDDIRQGIIRKVEMRRRIVWYNQYRSALKQQGEREPAPWYQRWLVDEKSDTPELDEFVIEVSEEKQAHIILPAISDDLANELLKNQEKYPGLVLQRGTHRFYPHNEAAAHLIGHMSYANAEDVKKYANTTDELNKYLPNDLVGRTGLESLCEPLLRGRLGKIEKAGGDINRVLQNIPPTPGKDVRTTIDVDLQQDISKIFEHVSFAYGPQGTPDDTLRMLGAAVVLDVSTNEVIALVSYPSYDLNTLDENYSHLAADTIEYPLLNRATQVAMEPGSTAKPMVGLGAITQGTVPPDVTIECNGFYYFNGKKIMTGRCWTESMWGGLGAHHAIPVPHPTGFLTFSDALERSCNVFFETVATRMGMEGLHYWFDQFGLGRPTGIGIAEISGRIPGDRTIEPAMRLTATRFSGIGQSEVLATPIQMANVAATIARNGIWMRPKLISDGVLPPTTSETRIPDRVDLKLSPAAIAEAKRGMYNVVNGAAGTGASHQIGQIGIKLAAKTGSAQASPLRLPHIDPSTGKQTYITDTFPVTDPITKKITMQERKRPEWDTLELGTHEHPNPMVKWYRGSGAKEDKISHAWYIGYAPADHPKIAFATMVYYGGGGGATAGYVAREVLEELIKHQYLQKQP